MNPRHELNRERMAQDIAVVLWASFDSFLRKSPNTPYVTSQLGTERWLALAQATGRLHAPSTETRELVVAKLAGLVNAERGGAPADCRDCHGHGSLAERDSRSSDGQRPAYDCPVCAGESTARCDHCGEAEARVVVPLGFYCEECSAVVFPSIRIPRTHVGAAAD